MNEMYKIDCLTEIVFSTMVGCVSLYQIAEVFQTLLINLYKKYIIKIISEQRCSDTNIRIFNNVCRSNIFILLVRGPHNG